MKTPLVIKLIYLRRFFTHFIFFWSVDKIFFTQRGASPLEISIILGLWALYVLIFEVPSGAIADRWSRKWLIVISSVFHAVAYFVWIFSHNFWMFLLGYLFRGTGGFLESGTKEAFLYDHLKTHRQEADFEKHTGRIWLITTVSFLITALVAGTLADRFSFTLVLILSILSNITALLIAIMIPDTPRSKSTEEISYWKFLGNAWKKALKQPVLLRALIYAATVVAAFESLDEYDQLYVNSVGLPLSLFGIWWLIRMTGEGIGGFIAHKFKQFNVQKVLNIIALINAGILMVSGFASGYVILPILGIMFGLFSIAKILNIGIIQRQILSHERATITSISALLVEAVAIVSGLAFGYVANITNARVGFIVFGILILVYFATQPIMTKLATLRQILSDQSKLPTRGGQASTLR